MVGGLLSEQLSPVQQAILIDSPGAVPMAKQGRALTVEA